MGWAKGSSLRGYSDRAAHPAYISERLWSEVLENKNIEVWDRISNRAATDFIRFALEDRDELEGATDPIERAGCARSMLAALFEAAVAMAGREVLELALGTDPGPAAPHSEHLEALASRLRLLSGPLGRHEAQDYPYSLNAVASELGYMASGDPPIVLKPAARKANKSARRREVEHWARALAWVEFLRMASDTKSECAIFVAEAYSVTPDRFPKWRSRVREELGEQAIRRIDRAGTKRTIDFRFATQEEGFAQLKADGKAYNAYLAGKAETKKRSAKVVSIRGE